MDGEVQEATDRMMRYCTPAKMSPAEAVDFMERVVADLEERIQCLREENPDLGED